MDASQDAIIMAADTAYLWVLVWEPWQARIGLGLQL